MAICISLQRRLGSNAVHVITNIFSSSAPAPTPSSMKPPSSFPPWDRVSVFLRVHSVFCLRRANLFPLLMGQLEAADELATQRVYLCLHHVLKELSTKRLLADQKNFAEVRRLARPALMRARADTTGFCTNCPNCYSHQNVSIDHRCLISFRCCRRRDAVPKSTVVTTDPKRTC